MVTWREPRLEPQSNSPSTLTKPSQNPRKTLVQVLVAAQEAWVAWQHSPWLSALFGLFWGERRIPKCIGSAIGGGSRSASFRINHKCQQSHGAMRVTLESLRSRSSTVVFGLECVLPSHLRSVVRIVSSLRDFVFVCVLSWCFLASCRVLVCIVESRFRDVSPFRVLQSHASCCVMS